MSLYNIVYGGSGDKEVSLLECLEPIEVPRYRDCYLIDKQTICVRTRTGGGNREAYEESNTALSQHPCYLRDYDCEWDTTYADFLFSVPAAHKEALEKRWDQCVINKKSEK